MTDVLRRVEHRASSGEPIDFDAFYRTTFDGAMQFARYKGSTPQSAGDAVHGAYLAMLERWTDRCTHTFVDNRNYLLTSIVNNLRRSRHRAGREAPLGDESVTDAAGDDIATEVLERLTFRQFLDRLSGQQRVIAVLAFQLNMKSAEIADVLGIDASTVRTQRSRIRAMAARFLGRDGQGGTDG